MEGALRLVRQHKTAVVTVAVISTALIAYTSFATSRQLDLTYLYFVTIGAIAWVSSRRTAFVAASITALLVLGCSLVHRSGGALELTVESSLAFGTFVTAALVVHTLANMFEHMGHTACFDALTDIPNTAHFQNLLASEFGRSRRYQRPLTLAFVDVDDFKLVNDTHGHRVGDRVLREIALAIRAEIRSADVLGRLGGDEFGLVLPETGMTEARVLLARVEERVTQLARSSGWPVSISVGATTLPASVDPRSTAEDLLHRADTLMYRAKQEGKGRVVLEEFVRTAAPAPIPESL